jgi:peptidoglycan hydrolase CwlO-like protein
MTDAHAEHRKPLVEQITTWVGSVSSLVLHTFVFIAFFAASAAHLLSWDSMFLTLTTVVSLEAIYLAIFIQMTVNRQGASLREVEKDVDEIQKDVDEIQEDVGDIQEDIQEINEETGNKEPAHAHLVTLESLTLDVKRLLADIESLKQKG